MPLLKRINGYLVRWARKKYRRLAPFKRAKRWWDDLLARNRPCSRTGNGRALSSGSDEKSGVNREVHAPFRGSPGVKFPRATRLSIYRREHAGEEPPLTVSERARLRELERETRELKMENEFLKKAAAYFARDHR